MPSTTLTAAGISSPAGGSAGAVVGVTLTLGASGAAGAGVALQAAIKRLPDAHERLAEVPESARDRSLREWQARSALLYQDWRALLATLDGMPVEEQQADEWRYWRAQALLEIGERDTAMTLLGTGGI